ncbi:MAG: reverse transcriptase family protein, partial [Nitrososphaeraceae archaeon]|nr:reverse transcriptase family protein [Nitrososphaeraceae archaeon]
MFINKQFNDVEVLWEGLKSIIIDSTKSCVPPSDSGSWKKKASWQHPINKDLQNLIKRKHRLWARYQETKDKKYEAEFKKLRNMVRKETRKVSSRFQQEIAASCKQNPKKFWRYVNSKTKSFKPVGNITVINERSGYCCVLESDIDKANAFSEYFMKVCSINSFITDVSVNIIMPPNSMPDITISENSINLKLQKLKSNTSPGPDNIHPRVLHELKDVISPHLKSIYEQSLIDGKIPVDWNHSSITVIHKKGKKSSIENYRPISLTCVACKVLESIIRDQLMYYFKSNALFSNCQYGFINGRSVALQLLKIVDDWCSCLDKGHQVDVIYTDFEKAFDKVPHGCLLGKLYSYGVNEKLIKWISAFLCYRTQCVKINGVSSDEHKVLSGIPQGSVLGPLLFVIFINDLPDVCTNLSKLFMFADDAKLYRELNCIADSVELNQNIQDVFNWSKKCGMKLNASKCKSLSIIKNKNNKQDYEYSFCDSDGKVVVLEHVSSMKDLGVTMDADLTFSIHIYEKINKAFQMLGIINRNFSDLDKFSFLLLYKSFVRSRVEYSRSV